MPSKRRKHYNDELYENFDFSNKCYIQTKAFSLFLFLVKTKTYIAVILTFIFLAKFVAVDADGLNAFFSGSNISFANLHCYKKDSPKQIIPRADFSQADELASQIISLNHYCTSQFQIEFYSWETDFPKTLAVFNEHFISRLSYLYLDNISPPPRLA